MRTEKELMKEILEAALIESVKSPDYSQSYFKDGHDILVYHGVIGLGKPNEQCDKIFNPWGIKEVLDCFLGADEEENYELEAKTDEEQSKLAIVEEEAERKAKIEVLTKLKARYVDLHDKIINATDSTDYDIGKMMAYGACISHIEGMLKDLE